MLLGTYPARVEIPGVGPVIVVKSDRARYIRLTISPDRTIRLTVPRRESIERGRQFLQSKIPWILRNLSRAAKREKPRLDLPNFEVSEQRAYVMLVLRLRELADIHEFDYSKVSIKNQKTKWGSCSSQNKINLNINLVRLPGQLRDYVIMHELVHTRIKNHSKAFWAELDKVLGGGARELARELRKYRIGHSA